MVAVQKARLEEYKAFAKEDAAIRKEFGAIGASRPTFRRAS
jgi:uncharacterized protein YbaA (DUF1428 family)